MTHYETCIVYWNGKPLTAREGEPLDAALLRAGIQHTGYSRKRHLPMGTSGSFLQGALVEIDGTPNCRVDRASVVPGMRVRRQGAWPAPAFDLLAGLGWIPPRLVRGGFEHTRLFPGGSRRFAAWERLLGFLAGGGRIAPEARAQVPAGQRIEVDAVVVGAGPSGCAAANALHARGRRVALVSRARVPGRFATALGTPVDPLYPGIRVFPEHEVFGVYRDGRLVAAAPHNPARPAITFHTAELVLAVGRVSLPPLVPGNHRIGLLEAGTALRLASHVPTALGRVAVCGTGCESAVGDALEDLGCNVILRTGIGGLKAIGGRSHVQFIDVGAVVPCDTVVHAGPYVTDRNLLRQAASRGHLRLAAGRLPENVRLAGNAATEDEYVALAEDGRWREASVCPCMDVGAAEIAELAEAGMTHVEELKRQTSCGMGPCQGFPCWELMTRVLEGVCGRRIADRPSARGPRRAITVAQAAGLVDTVEPEK